MHKTGLFTSLGKLTLGTAGCPELARGQHNTHTQHHTHNEVRVPGVPAALSGTHSWSLSLRVKAQECFQMGVMTPRLGNTVLK